MLKRGTTTSNAVDHLHLRIKHRVKFEEFEQQQQSQPATRPLIQVPDQPKIVSSTA